MLAARRDPGSPGCTTRAVVHLLIGVTRDTASVHVGIAGRVLMPREGWAFHDAFGYLGRPNDGGSRLIT